jgi:hypothetical protein
LTARFSLVAMPRLTPLSFVGICLFALFLTASAFGGDAMAAGGCDTADAPTSVLYLPNVTKTLGGPSGWVTPFYVQNAGAVQTTVEASFFRFRDGGLVACHKTAGLEPGASLVDNPNADLDLPDDTQFSVVVKSFGAPIVAVVNQLQSSGATQQALSYSGFTQGDPVVYLPNVTRRFFGYDVPFIVQDLGTATASVSARFISFDGRSTFTRSFTVAPGRSAVVDPDFEPAFSGAPNTGLVDGTQYGVTLTATQPIAVVVNAHNEVGAPVAFSHNGIGKGATTLYAPYAAKAVPPGDTFSPIVVQNLGTTPTDAQLVFTSFNAAVAPQTFTLRAIPAGGAQAFDPRFGAGTTTPCAVAGTGCLGNGEYSLKITAANPVAAVVLPNSATTAAGYLAATQLSPRALVPVALRRIGGVSGWSTRMVAYTGASAQLTVRAFAVPSGDLKATFPLPVGAAGATSFDLNAVAGLADDAQYSVTIDGGGVPLAAVALERAATGGDAFMAFEGFGLPALSATIAPASVRVTPSPPAIPVTWTQQFAASVKDQFGGALPEQTVTWTLSSAALGTITSSGFFSAGPTASTGVLVATAGAVTTRVPITVQVPPTVVLGGLTLWSFSAGSADVYTETTIGAAGTQAVVVEVDADTAQIQKDYARTYAGRPAVYALGSASTFVKAVQTIGGSSSPPPSWAGGICICYDPHPDWVFVDWPAAKESAQLTAIRHELTHVIEHQSAPLTAQLPAWFDEGNARAEEFTVAGTQWFAAEQRYRAASMAAQGSLFTLADLTSPLTWSERLEPGARYQYAVAAQAVQFLRADVGMGGELLIFNLMAQGHTFNEAYGIVAGRSVAQFDSGFAARVGALAPKYPGVSTAPDSLTGPGLTFFMYGLPANAAVAYSISGTSSSNQVTRTTDAYGFLSTFLDNAWPAGSYTMTVNWSAGSVSGSGVKN